MISQLLGRLQTYNSYGLNEFLKSESSCELYPFPVMVGPEEFCCCSPSTSAETVKVDLFVAGFWGHWIIEEDEEDNGEVIEDVVVL